MNEEEAMKKKLKDRHRRLRPYFYFLCGFFPSSQRRSRIVYAVDKGSGSFARSFAEEFNCAWTTDFDEILDKDIDVVHLCLPHFLHPVMAIKAMKAGINVLTEKPIAISLQDADKCCTARRKPV